MNKQTENQKQASGQGKLSQRKRQLIVKNRPNRQNHEAARVEKFVKLINTHSKTPLMMISPRHHQNVEQ